MNHPFYVKGLGFVSAGKLSIGDEIMNASGGSYPKIRVDAIGEDPVTGNVVINEFKSSQTAPLTSNQKIGFPELEIGGGTVVGKGKGTFTGGYDIPAGTKVEIVRPPLE